MTCQTFRHPFPHIDSIVVSIGTVQELLGHRGVATIMIYAHVLRVGARGVRSPLDFP